MELGVQWMVFERRALTESDLVLLMMHRIHYSKTQLHIIFNISSLWDQCKCEGRPGLCQLFSSDICSTSSDSCVAACLNLTQRLHLLINRVSEGQEHRKQGERWGDDTVIGQDGRAFHQGPAAQGLYAT